MSLLLFKENHGHHSWGWLSWPSFTKLCMWAGVTLLTGDTYVTVSNQTFLVRIIYVLFIHLSSVYSYPLLIYNISCILYNLTVWCNCWLWMQIERLQELPVLTTLELQCVYRDRTVSDMTSSTSKTSGNPIWTSIYTLTNCAATRYVRMYTLENT